MDDMIESFVDDRIYAKIVVRDIGNYVGNYIAIGDYLSAKINIDYIKNMLMRCYILNDQTWIAINKEDKTIHIGTNNNIINLTEYWFGYDKIKYLYEDFIIMFRRILSDRHTKEIRRIYYKIMLEAAEKFKTTLQCKIYLHV